MEFLAQATKVHSSNEPLFCESFLMRENKYELFISLKIENNPKFAHILCYKFISLPRIISEKTENLNVNSVENHKYEPESRDIHSLL